MAEDRVCQGYKGILSKRIKKVEVVLAHNPNALDPYVTWKAYAHTQFQSFAYGRYFSTLEDARENFRKRVDEVREDYGLPPKQRKSPDRGGMNR